MNPKVYLAAPFFQEDERILVAQLSKAIEDSGYDLHSPSRDGIVIGPDSTDEDKDNAFHQNCVEMDSAHLLVMMPERHVIVNGSAGIDIAKRNDTGTVWEGGFSYRAFKPIVFFYRDIKDMNLMIARSAIAHVGTTEALKEVLTLIRPALGDLKPAEDYARIVAEIQAKYRFSGEIH